jgi:hypothetical protein
MTRIFILLFILTSCGGNEFEKDLRNVNKVQIYFYNEGDTLTYVENEKDDVDALKDVMVGSPKQTDCERSGRVHFMEGNDVKLEVSIACQYLVNYTPTSQRAYQLNYLAGNYLNELYARLKKEHDVKGH